MIEYLFIAAHFWREILLGLALAAVVTIGVKWKHAIQHEQQLKDQQAEVAARLAVADSTNRVLADSLGRVAPKVDTAIKTVLRLVTRTDTLEQWRHDTITVAGVPSFPVPVATVVKQDTANAACRDLAFNCSAFKRFALEKFHTDSGTIRDLRTHPLVIQTSCKAHDAVSFLVGVGLGAGADRLFHR